MSTKWGHHLIFLIGNYALAGSNVEVTNIKTKIIEKDSLGNVWYAIKADVRNLGDDSDVSVRLQAINREGFELTDTTLSGTIKPGQSKTLTDKTFMPYKNYRQIYKWQVE